MNVAHILAGEKEIEARFQRLLAERGETHEMVTDGVVDASRYVESSPKILWILREPWEELDAGEVGGDWSVSKDVFSKAITSNRGAIPVMAYISFSVNSGFPAYEQMDYATDNPEIGEALKNIALINIKKTPGGTSSWLPEIAEHYHKNRALLMEQVSLLAPQVIIGGGTLGHFYDDFNLSDSSFNKERSSWFVEQQGVLYIHAYHPAHRRGKARYVDDIVSIIRQCI